MRFQNHSASGFTLIELLVTMIIAGILFAIAVPAYNNYVTQSRISAAVAQLADMRVKMEQFFQDNRSYAGACTAGTVAPLPATANNFSYSCPVRTDTAYTVTATGSGPMNQFVYSIDQNNTRTTDSLPSGWTTNPNPCWVVKPGGSC